MSNPMYKNPHKKTDSKKARIWLLVTELQNNPIETNDALRKNNPMYEPHIPPLSTLPTGMLR